MENLFIEINKVHFEEVQNRINTALTNNIDGYNSLRWANEEHQLRLINPSGALSGKVVMPIPNIEPYKNVVLQVLSKREKTTIRIVDINVDTDLEPMRDNV